MEQVLGLRGVREAGGLERHLVLALRIGAPLAIAIFYVGRIVSGQAPELRFFDDFFYYVTAAQNWVDGLGSTFFPGEPTNGYHPLWFVWTALLYRVFGAGDALFVAVDLSLAALAVGFFFLFERFLFRLTGDRLAAAVGAGFAAIRIALVAAAGVEMALTAFAVALLLERLTVRPLADHRLRDAALIGLLGAFVALSRLDALLLAPGLALVVLPRWDLKRLGAAVVGAAPLFIYFACNLVIFGDLSTTSMSAKSLATYVPPNLYVLAGSFALQTTIIGACLIAAMLLRRAPDVDMRRIGWVLASVPLIQIAVQAFMSGWLMFYWYFYYGLMVQGMVAALAVVVLRGLSGGMVVGKVLGVATVAVCGVWVADGLKVHSPQREIVQIARQLRTFAATHPGVYAMGDAAGVPGWTLGQPIVHLEGLMMSHAFLERIKTQRPLEETFRDYRVEYYVTLWPESQTDGCLAFAEPSAIQASKRSPKMRMTICTAPLAEFEPGEGYHARVYRIDPATGRPA